MKVLNIVAEGRFGGPQKRILEVGIGLKAKGIETVVVLPNYDSDRFQGLLADNQFTFEAISIHRLTKDIKHLLGFIFLFIPELFRLIRIIKKHKPDVVHCNGAWQIKGIIASKLTGTPSIWHLNDTYMPGYILWIFKPIAHIFSDKFIGSSIRTREFYSARAVPKNKAMPIVLPPVNTSKFDPARVDSVPEIVNSEGVNVVTVGNVNPIKGYPTFIKMIANVNALCDQKVNFFIAGKLLDNQKKLTESLMQMVKDLKIDNVHFMGGRSDIPQILKSADIFVCPSLSESGPMSVFEAMAMEKPVVSTDVGDVRSLFGDGECGIIVPVEGDKAMAEAVVELVKDKNKRIMMGKAARQKAIEKLDVSSCVNTHEEVYRRALD